MMALPFLAIGLSVLGTLSAANSQKQQAEASAQASLYNAQIAQRDADIARQQAAADADMQATDARRRIATMQAGFAAGGAVSGSALDVLADSATQAEKDNQTIKYKGDVVIESFTNKVKSIARAAAIWRPFESSQDALAENGLRFLKQLLAN